jgi:hypothetical protein
MFQRFALIIGIFVNIAGCVPPGLRDQTLPPVAYTGSVVAASNLAAELQVYSGAISAIESKTTVAVGGAFVPVTAKHVEKFDFTKNDEESFSSSLRSELVRTHLFADVKSLPIDSPQSATGTNTGTVLIDLRFVSTERQYATYTLNVDMHVAGSTELTRSYRVVSSEGDTTWQDMNTNNIDGKRKAANKLLGKIMSDLDAWLMAENS